MADHYFLVAELDDVEIMPGIGRTTFCNPNVILSDTPEHAEDYYKYMTYARKAKTVATLHRRIDEHGNYTAVKPFRQDAALARKMFDLWATGAPGRHRVAVIR